MSAAVDADFYDRTALWFATGRVAPRDRERAAHLRGDRAMRVLELGAGHGGTAAAMAELGHEVVAVERSPQRAWFARRLAASTGPGRVTVVEADFLDVELDGTFDAVTCWSGFGMGPDGGHLALLRRIAAWLRPDGRALIEVFASAWWRATAGDERHFGPLHRRFGFDAEGQRLELAYSVAATGTTLRESIRCYDATELAALCHRAGLAMSPASGTGTGTGTGEARAPAEPTWLAELRRS